MDVLWQAVDLAGIATKIAAIGAVVVGIHMTMKGITIVKRVVNKV